MKARSLLALLALSACAILSPACADDPATSLVLALSSEASIPKEIDSISIQISRSGNTRFAHTYQVDPTTGSARLPGTLTIKPRDNEDPADPVRVEILANVRGYQLGLRSATASFVEGKQKLLRIALRYSCLDAPLSCDVGSTCIGGRCASDAVDTSKLPDLGSQEVFPVEGQPGCFNAGEGAVGCAREPRMEVPDMAAFVAAGCVLDTKATADQLGQLNVFAFWQSKQDQAHPLPLEAHSPEGWDTPKGGPTSAFQLAGGLCDAAAQGRIRKVVYSFHCPTKTEDTPVCLPASEPATRATFFDSACHRCVYYRQLPGQAQGQCEQAFTSARTPSDGAGPLARCASECLYDGHYDTGDECLAVRSCFFGCLSPYLDCLDSGCPASYDPLVAWSQCLDGFDYEKECASVCAAEGVDRCQ